MEAALQAVLGWLATLPASVLYLVLALAAFTENLVPPLPADTVIAVGAFLAAHGTGHPLGAWVATMIGNIAGAIVMYRLGARLGLSWVMSRLPIGASASQAEHIGQRFSNQGLLAVVVSRFLPGIRALVPPVAGALGIPFIGTVIAMASASALWYGLICVLAYQTGAHTDQLLAVIGARQRDLAIGAGVLALIGIAIAWSRHRRAPRRADD